MELLLYASVRIEDIRWLSFRNYLQIKGNIGFYGDQSSGLGFRRFYENGYLDFFSSIYGLLELGSPIIQHPQQININYIFIEIGFGMKEV